ncbi:dienelactone hydrolase family protein [Microbacterium immunditiarum]|uniref:Carboxymethylenebutenolidase n=1 Tax=Microbacterium immunditiarum TaxID=337480 RepID=A0A7Y9KKD3_9MICO|nr:dienelactone hydrolase family protein [Microbacterium immunditiarum]NYE20740.1 carboxymethylenebutenolidase [Microbacterium immunditiarum]
MSETITLEAHGEPFDVYLARPPGEPVGGLVLIHEIWGLVDHIKDVADRYAAEGWLVAAPDILSHAGVEPALGAELFAIRTGADEEAKAATQPRMREAMSAAHAPDYAKWAVAALRATVDRLVEEPGVGERVAVTGFCFGGTYAFALAAADDRIRAAVPFYGTAPRSDRIANITSPVLALYGRHDPALIDALPDVTKAMADAGVSFESVVYPQAGHAFFNDTGPRYDVDAAADAWRRVLAFLREHV